MRQRICPEWMEVGMIGIWIILVLLRVAAIHVVLS